MTRVRQAATALALALLVGACAAEAPTSEPAAPDPSPATETDAETLTDTETGTEARPSRSGSPLCTAEDEIVLRTLVEDRVLAAIDAPVDLDLVCEEAGTWRWDQPYLEADIPPERLRERIDTALTAEGLAGRPTDEQPDGGWRVIWRGSCAPDLGCSIDVTSGPSPTDAVSISRVRVHAQHTDHDVDHELRGDELADQGIAWVAAAPVSDYCRDTVPAIHGHGTSRAPTSFLTVELRGPERHCNTVPIELRFVAAQRHVTVHFSGADQPYLLQGLDAAGNVVAEATQHGSPYDYDRDFTVSIDAGEAVVERVVFGHEKSLTLVFAIDLGITAPVERTVRFDGFDTHHHREAAAAS